MNQDYGNLIILIQLILRLLLFKEIKSIEFQDEITRISYSEAMENYGNDKPDLRFGMTIHDITRIVKGSSGGREWFVVFTIAFVNRFIVPVDAQEDSTIYTF